MEKLIELKLSLLLINFFTSQISSEVLPKLGEDCQLLNNNIGTCTLLKDCQLTSNYPGDIRVRHSCHFDGREEVVCCSIQPSKFDNSQRISRKKCQEYGKSVFVNKPIPTLIPNQVTTILNVSMCKINSQALIISGPLATSGTFPHMALIGYKNADSILWHCSGVLISDQYVLTTAICTENGQLGIAVSVRLGELDFNSTQDDANTQDFWISEILVHPEFQYGKIYNDIALLKLEQSVDFKTNYYIRPACLPNLDNIDHNNYLVSGWEILSSNPKTHLSKYIINGRESNQECNAKYNGNRLLPLGIDSDIHFCARANEGVCQMASGSTLQIYEKDVYCMYDVIGIKSFGKICEANAPNVFTKIAPYIDWIETIVWP